MFVGVCTTYFLHIFSTNCLKLLERYHLNTQAVLSAAGMNGLSPSAGNQTRSCVLFDLRCLSQVLVILSGLLNSIPYMAYGLKSCYTSINNIRYIQI